MHTLRAISSAGINDLRRRMPPFLNVSTCQVDCCVTLRKRLCDGQADATVGSGHDCSLAMEIDEGYLDSWIESSEEDAEAGDGDVPSQLEVDQDRRDGRKYGQHCGVRVPFQSNSNSCGY